MTQQKVLALALFGAVMTLPVTAQAQAVSTVWHAITFGQSTDLNFSSNVLPEKVGVNEVTINGRRLGPGDSADLSRPITIESRGGKIANSHDGLTFYYTRLPATQNFSLQSTVWVEQFGPETAAKPAAQEGAGLLVRDVIGVPRQQPLKPGYEEFPAAANMVMNAIQTQDKKDKQHVKMQAIWREGIFHPWGDAGAAITRQSYQQGLDLARTPRFRLKLERTNEGFITGWAPEGSEQWVTQQVPHADSVTVQDKQYYYVGFFAARNAKITFSDARLTTSEARTVPSPPWVASQPPIVVQLASASLSATPHYSVQARANQDGTFSLRQGDTVIGTEQQVSAGEMYLQPTRLTADTHFTLSFTSTSGESISKSIDVALLTQPVAQKLYAAPDGKAENAGNAAAPLDLNSAIMRLPPGGELVLLPGDYPYTTIATTDSGLADQPKSLTADGKVVIHGLMLDASYWKINGIQVTDKSLRIQGSHNLIEGVTAWHNDDTGIQISSPAEVGRALWAHHNLVRNAESYGNEDPGKINADGFAVKMRVREGNRLEGCYAHDNIDDGFDLFNKIEDGANGVVVIERSIARNNTSNGFKLGGEGQPVAHQIHQSIAIGNGLDGFTDNFNPGQLLVSDNQAVDNQRFNFIFRPSPYGGPETQGIFSNNRSLRSAPGQYDDAVSGRVDNSNVFIRNGMSQNGAGEKLDASAFRSLTLPDPLMRNADGSFQTGDFLLPAP